MESRVYAAWDRLKAELQTEPGTAILQPHLHSSPFGDSFQVSAKQLMSYTGTVEHGIVKLPPEADLADGTKVRIEPLQSQANPHKFASADLMGSVDGDGIPATNERVRKVMGGGRP